MKNIPNKIYLQVDPENDKPEDFNDLAEVTWCQDRIFDSDISFVRQKNINWQKVREKFFNECTDEITRNYTGTQTQMRKINVAPHDLFEWFKRNLQKGN